jgi:hypothetical protein
VAVSLPCQRSGEVGEGQTTRAGPGISRPISVRKVARRRLARARSVVARERDAVAPRLTSA